MNTVLQPPGVCSLWFSTQKAAPYSSRPSPQRLGALGARARVGVVRACVLSMPRRFPRILAEKNLLKIHLSNWYVRLNVVNNRTGHIFLQANTQERVLQRQLLGHRSLNDRVACATAAELLCERARRQNVTQVFFPLTRPIPPICQSPFFPYLTCEFFFSFFSAHLGAAAATVCRPRQNDHRHIAREWDRVHVACECKAAETSQPNRQRRLFLGT